MLEKAWAKVKGNYLNANGGLLVNGLRSIVGVPIYSYALSAYSTTADTDLLHNLINAADNAGYLMGLSTAGGGDDS